MRQRAFVQEATGFSQSGVVKDGLGDITRQIGMGTFHHVVSTLSKCYMYSNVY